MIKNSSDPADYFHKRISPQNRNHMRGPRLVRIVKNKVKNLVTLSLQTVSLAWNTANEPTKKGELT